MSAQAVAELCEAIGMWALVWWRRKGAVLPALPPCTSATHKAVCAVYKVHSCMLSCLSVGHTLSLCVLCSCFDELCDTT